ncbi:MAG: hypothetical protein JWN95_3645 [Frankiales bacterium]|nr:hypothetical protein [Frankiales bacterium]
MRKYWRSTDPTPVSLSSWLELSVPSSWRRDTPSTEPPTPTKPTGEKPANDPPALPETTRMIYEWLLANGTGEL